MTSRYILVGVIAAVAAVWGGWFFSQQRSMQAFQNPNTALTFRYPKSWEEEDLTKGNLQAVVLVRVRPKGAEKVSLQVTQKQVATKPSDEEVMAEVEKSLKESFPTFQLINKPSVEANGTVVPLLHYRYKTLDREEDVEQVMGVFWNGNIAHYVIGQASPDQFKRYLGTFQRIMSTISFKR